MYMPPFEKLQNASLEDLLKIIHSTKIKMGRLRKKMEHPDYRYKTEIVSPSDDVIYKCDRDFLNMAIIKYINLGGDYKWSHAEKKETEFNDNLENIKKIIFYNGTCFSIPKRTIIEINGEELKVESGDYDCMYPMETDHDKESFLYQLGELHLGEWRPFYSAKRYGKDVLDGIQWFVEIQYNNGRKKKFAGSNAYPYNFDELLVVLMLNKNQLSVE